MILQMVVPVVCGLFILMMAKIARSRLNRLAMRRALTVPAAYLLISPLFVAKYGVAESVLLLMAFVVMGLVFWRFDYLQKREIDSN